MEFLFLLTIHDLFRCLFFLLTMTFCSIVCTCHEYFDILVPHILLCSETNHGHCVCVFRIFKNRKKCLSLSLSLYFLSLSFPSLSFLSFQGNMSTISLSIAFSLSLNLHRHNCRRYCVIEIVNDSNESDFEIGTKSFTKFSCFPVSSLG